MNAKIKDIMNKLDCTEEEAIELLEMDDEIDHGADPFKLTPEQEKVSKAARSVDRKPANPGEKNKRTRKEDPTKRRLIADIRVLLEGLGAEDMEVINIERQLDFKIDGRRFRVVLSAPRK